MGKMKADLIRKVERLIPFTKDKSNAISSSEIKEKLRLKENSGQQKKSFDKKIERYLTDLADEGRVTHFVDKGIQNYYYKTERNKPSIESMETETATAFLLLEKYSKDLPEFIKSKVNPWFMEAKASFTELPIAEKKIFQNIKITTKFFPLEPEPIRKDITEVVYSALKQKRQIRFSYRKLRLPEEDYIVHPLGIDIRHNVAYLIAQKIEENSIKIFKMSRMTRANLLSEKSVKPRTFNLDEFVKNDYSRSGTKKKISIEILLHKKWWHIIDEYTVEDNWTEKESSAQGNWKLVTFTSFDSARLHEWIWGLGSGVIVRKPTFLAKKFESDVEELLQNYKSFK